MWIRVGSIIALLAAITGCGASGSSGSTQPAESVKLGALFSVTGSSSAIGLAALAGVKTAVHDINSTGGVTVGGKRYKLTIVDVDAASAADKTTAGAIQLLRDSQVPVLFGPDESANALAAQAQVSKYPAMFFTIASTISANLDSSGVLSPPNQYTFTTSAPIASVVKALIDQAAQDQKSAKTAAIMAPNLATYDGLVQAASQYLAAHNIAVSPDHVYRHIATVGDFTPLLTRVKAFHPDILVQVGSTGEVVTAIAKQMADIGDVAGSLYALGGQAAIATSSAWGCSANLRISSLTCMCARPITATRCRRCSISSQPVASFPGSARWSW